MNGHVAHDRGRQIELQRLPMVAAIERHPGARHGAGVQQIGINRILAYDAYDFAVGQPGRDLLPGVAVIAGAIDVRMRVAR